MESKFTIGQVVKLKSGGPLMTVSKIKNTSITSRAELPFSGIISTTWFEGTTLKTERFEQNTLELSSNL